MAVPIFSTGDVPTATQVNDWFVNILFARKTSDETISSSTTLHNDTQLFVSVKANAVYHVILELRELAQPADDFKIGFTGPAGYAFTGGVRGPEGNATTLLNTYTSEILSGTPLAFGGIASNNLVISIQGLLITSGTAGTFQLQWAQNASSASGTTLKANSFMLLRQVA
jgi:hypothetical protein